jgi:predicted transcriptional regulator
MPAEGIELPPEVAKEVAKLHKALSHHARVMIISYSKNLRLSRISEQTGFTLQALQRHVKELVKGGLIKKGKGKGVYELTEEGELVYNICKHFHEIPRIKRMIQEKKKERSKEELRRATSELKGIATRTLKSPTLEKLKKILEEIEEEIQE